MGDSIKPEVVSMAEAAGHTVLYTPPHYSDLQPIELIWAHVKQAVGMQYTVQTKFTDALERLKRAFTEVTPHIVQGCINKANKSLKKLHAYICQKDEAEDKLAQIPGEESESAGSDEEESEPEDHESGQESGEGEESEESEGESEEEDLRGL